MFNEIDAETNVFKRTKMLNCEGVVCKIQNSQFMNMVFSMITLFWTNMGIVDLSAPTVNKEHAFTRSVAIAVFVVYHVFSIVILLNMLIAMMSLSYDTVVQNADVEWKFARAKVIVVLIVPFSTIIIDYNHLMEGVPQIET